MFSVTPLLASVTKYMTHGGGTIKRHIKRIDYYSVPTVYINHHQPGYNVKAKSKLVLK